VSTRRNRRRRTAVRRPNRKRRLFRRYRLHRANDRAFELDRSVTSMRPRNQPRHERSRVYRRQTCGDARRVRGRGGAPLSLTQFTVTGTTTAFARLSATVTETEPALTPVTVNCPELTGETDAIDASDDVADQTH